jgi:hypothetical protein
VDDLLVSFAIRPNHPGRNYVAVSVFDTRRPAPAPAQKVVVAVRGPDGTPVIYLLAPAGEHRWQAAGDAIDRAGTWRVTVQISRPGLADSHLRTRWTVRSVTVPTPREPTLISARPLAPVLDRMATVLGALLLATGLLILLVRARRRGPSTATPRPTVSPSSAAPARVPAHQVAGTAPPRAGGTAERPLVTAGGGPGATEAGDLA